jgi:hypothetical protein
MAVALQSMHCQMWPQQQLEQRHSSSSSLSLQRQEAQRPWGEGSRGHNDDLDLIAGSLCDVRCRQQQDARIFGDSGNCGGGGGLTFGAGKVGCRPLCGMVGLGNQVSEIYRALWVFTGQNRPEDAILSIDGDPLQLDPKRSFIRGHLKVDRQLLDGILPPWHAPIKYIHDSALNECLGIVYIAVDVPHGMVAQNSVHDSMIGQKKRGGGGGGRSSTTHDNQQKATWVCHLFWSFWNDRKITSMMNEMAI